MTERFCLLFADCEQGTLAPCKRAPFVSFQMREGLAEFRIILELSFWVTRDCIEKRCFKFSDPQQTP
jgi:hypothetical protein